MAEDMQNELQNELQNENEADIRQYEVGDLVKGVVAKVEDKHALVDFGYKIDAILPIGEISNVHIEKVADVLHVDDEIEAIITKMTEDEIVISKRRVDSVNAWAEMVAKYESGETFEVVIAEVVKGGLVVDVGVRGFIPASHVERHFVEDFSSYLGQHLRVKVIEMDQEKNKLILSQKVVLDEEADQQKLELLQSLEAGQVLDGTVQRLTSFGVFVDIGGVDGLVHISELSWSRVETASEVVAEGDVVQVKVLKVDPESEKISLSIKATEPSPWAKAAAEIKKGDVVEGVVKRLVSFGAFVEVLPGVEGLVHISQIANYRVGTPGEVLEEGQQVKAKVIDVNEQDERMSLSIRELLEEEESGNLESYNAQEEQHSGVTLGDMFGDQLKKFK